MERHRLVGRQYELSYLRSGGNDGSPVVFIHGFTGWANSWLPFEHSVGNRPWFALDLPGHGESRRGSRYSYQDDAAATIEFLEYVARPSILIGHSRGGLVACLVGNQRPDLVRATFLEDVTPKFWFEARSRNLPWLSSVFKIGALGAQASREERTAEWVAEQAADLRHDASSTLGQRLVPDALFGWSRATMALDPEVFGPNSAFAAPLESAADILRSLPGRTHLAHGTVPTGTALGEGELTWFLETAEQPSSTPYSGLGHFLHWARPKDFADDLSEFVREVGA